MKSLSILHGHGHSERDSVSLMSLILVGAASALGWSCPVPSAVGAPLCRGRVQLSVEFQSAAWGVLRAQLDELPVFAVANARGTPLPQHEPTFFCDMDAAEKACEDWSQETPELDIMPVGLGIAYQAQAEGRGRLVPGGADLDAAGADADAKPGSIPMFLCQDLVSERIDGGVGSIPVFMSAADAHAAVADAGGADLSVECVSLQAVIEKALQIESEAEPGFRWIGASASVEAIRAATQAAGLL
jgi:hypothetical protein